jgi:hypothetical protein
MAAIFFFDDLNLIGQELFNNNQENQILKLKYEVFINYLIDS